ncbi:MAG: hypothetical protein U5K81_15105 [Trueperaceae bacterium]|nr:hypothetical protein [Trueperaceae bacterium]
MVAEFQLGGELPERGYGMLVRRSLGTVLVVVVMMLAGSAAFAQESERTVVRIEMGEYYFQIEGQEQNEAIVLEAGRPYEFVFANVGTMEHEVLVGRDLVMVDGAPDGYETNLLDAVDVDVVGDDWEVGTSGLIEIELEEGESVTIHVTVPSELIGTWEIACFVPGHYEAGMKAPFVIE